MRALFGILGLAGAGFLLSGVTSTVGCSSSSSGGSSGSTGSAGSTGHGGSTGTAGTQGSGGTSNTGTGGGGGGGGGGGSGPAAGCAVSDLAMGDPLIADFSTTDGGPVLAIGGTFVYPNPGGPVATVSGGAWQVAFTTTSMGSNQYWGAGIYFNGNSTGTDCVDATSHTGVQFDIKGTFTGTMTGCSVQYSTNDSAHADSTAGSPPDPKAAGPAGSYAPQLDITSMLTAGGATLKVPFVGTGAPANGSPATGISKDKLVGVQWQLTTMASSACTLTLTIDNVMFYD